MSRLKKTFYISLLIIAVLFVTVTINAFSSSMTQGLMGNAERATIINARFVDGVPASDTIKVTIGNAGKTNVIIHDGYANENKTTNISPTPAIIPKGYSQTITLTFPKGTLVHGTEYQVKIVTTKGTSLQNILTYNSTYTSLYDPLKDDVIPTPSTFYMATTAEQEQTKVLFSTLILAVIADVGACFFANHVIHPKNRLELLVLLFFVTMIVGFAMLAVVSPILFPPTTGLM